jgi:hypothetical protein
LQFWGSKFFFSFLFFSQTQISSAWSDSVVCQSNPGAKIISKTQITLVLIETGYSLKKMLGIPRRGNSCRETVIMVRAFRYQLKNLLNYPEVNMFL